MLFIPPPPLLHTWLLAPNFTVPSMNFLQKSVHKPDKKTWWCWTKTVSSATFLGAWRIRTSALSRKLCNRKTKQQWWEGFVNTIRGKWTVTWGRGVSAWEFPMHSTVTLLNHGDPWLFQIPQRASSLYQFLNTLGCLNPEDGKRAVRSRLLNLDAWAVLPG